MVTIWPCLLFAPNPVVVHSRHVCTFVFNDLDDSAPAPLCIGIVYCCRHRRFMLQAHPRRSHGSGPRLRREVGVRIAAQCERTIAITAGGDRGRRQTVVRRAKARKWSVLAELHLAQAVFASPAAFKGGSQSSTNSNAVVPWTSDPVYQ